MSSVRGERVEMGPAEVATFGPFRLFPSARRLERDGVTVEIGGRALDLLIELVNQAGRVVSKAELMSTIWPDITVVEGVLRTHIYNLRRALGDGVGGVRYVTSVAGRGYCFVAPVVRGASEAAASIAPSAWKHGLPPRLARMAGRDEVVRKLAAHVLETRFVTIHGAAGIGKTTVAVAVGHALLGDFRGAVCFVELGSLLDPALVAATIASTLGLRTQTDEARESIHAFLQNKRVLLVLDNCEHVVEGAARLAEQLFLRAPHAHLLTTSREALRAEGERTHRLAPLETPPEALGLNAETVQYFPAVQVFLERAAASGWSGDLTDHDVPVVVETCRRLDGVPLAIEFAASFVGQCGLQGMAAVLDDRLRLLSQRGRRTAPPRQQTLNALIAWSYDRLSDYERTVLRRLSVFVGTFTFHAAKAVVVEGADSDASLADVMNELVGKSLLTATVEDGAVVYRLLETTRVYALERLAVSGEFERTSLRHALLFAERLEPIGGARGAELDAPRRQASDLGNVRAALKWSLSSPVAQSVGARLVAAAAQMFLELGLLSECQTWCRRALEVVGTSESGAFVELDLREAFAISTMFSRGNGEDVRDALVRGVELARSLGGGDHEIRLLGHLNSFFIRRGEFRDALEVAERSLGPARDAALAGQIRARWMLAFSHHLAGNQANAEEQCVAALHLEAKLGESPPIGSLRSHGHFSPSHLSVLARTRWLRGQADTALATAREVVQGVAALKHPFEKAGALILCEAVFVWCGEWAEAERLLEMLFELVDRYSLGTQRSPAMALRGELLVKTGRAEEGCTLLRAAASMLEAEQNRSFVSVYGVALAEGLAATGHLEEALRTVDGAIVDAERRGGTFDLPELLRVKGILLGALPSADGEAVDETFSAAVRLAQRQGAIAWEVRARSALGRERLSGWPHGPDDLLLRCQAGCLGGRDGRE